MTIFFSFLQSRLQPAPPSQWEPALLFSSSQKYSLAYLGVCHAPLKVVILLDKRPIDQDSESPALYTICTKIMLAIFTVLWMNEATEKIFSDRYLWEHIKLWWKKKQGKFQPNDLKIFFSQIYFMKGVKCIWHVAAWLFSSDHIE